MKKTKKTVYGNSVFKRIISGVLAVVIFFNAAPLDLSFLVRATTTSMGIFNNFLTENNELSTKYIIKYFAKDPVYETNSQGQIVFEDQIKKDDQGNTVYDEDGDPVIIQVPKVTGYTEVEKVYDSYFTFTTSGSDTATIDADGSLNLKPGETLDFTSNADFTNFLKNNKIEKITVTYFPDNNAYLYDPAKAGDPDDQSHVRACPHG